MYDWVSQTHRRVAPVQRAPHAIDGILGLAFASPGVPPLHLCCSPLTKQEFGTKKHSCEQGRSVRNSYQRELDCALLQEASRSKEQVPVPDIARTNSLL